MSEDNEKAQEIPKLPERSFIGTPFARCEHCHCGKMWANNQEHRTCCMCGHRTLTNPVTF